MHWKHEARNLEWIVRQMSWKPPWTDHEPDTFYEKHPRCRPLPCQNPPAEPASPKAKSTEETGEGRPSDPHDNPDHPFPDDGDEEKSERDTSAGTGSDSENRLSDVDADTHGKFTMHTATDVSLLSGSP